METVARVRLEDVLDLALLSSHMKNGLVSQTRHPSLPLRIYNYTHLAAHENPWGDGTIDWCRGLIVDDAGYVIARPFKKFHNFNTASVPETHEANLPKTTPTILEKLDGSLGILWRYENEWGIATRGSFTSPQAQWATGFVERGLELGCIDIGFPTGLTPLFEILYRENRIVVQYYVDTVCLLGLVRNDTGHEAAFHLVNSIGTRKGFRVVQQHHGLNIHDCLGQNEKNREGYVLSYSMGIDKPSLKVKIKFADYVRLHKIVTGMNPRSVWELLSTGKNLDELFSMDLPEHFKSWLSSWADQLVDGFDTIYNTAQQFYLNRPVYEGDEMRRYRGVFAAWVKTLPPSYSGILFTMLDGINPTDIIWKQLKPRGDDKSFRTEGE